MAIEQPRTRTLRPGRPGAERQVVKSKSGSTVGHVVEGVFIKVASRSKHFLRKPQAIAIDADSYDRSKILFTAIQVNDSDSGDVFTLSRAEFEQYRQPLDRGFGRQYFVPLERWQYAAAGSAQNGALEL